MITEEEHLQFRKNNLFYDCKGKQILVGDVLKVYHFATINKIYYMYHDVVMQESGFPVMACKDYNSDEPHYMLYQVCDPLTFIYEGAEIISGSDWRTKRKRIKAKKGD
jgi:hypothetical protein